MRTLRLMAGQVVLENRAFWRNPAAAFFTVVFPLVFMVIANVALVDSAGGREAAARFYTPAIMAFALITACYTNLAMSVVAARDAGILKRLRGTPLPTWIYLWGRIVESVLIAGVLVAIVSLYGTLVQGVLLPVDRYAALGVALVVGAAAFSALGLAVSGIVPNAAAAPAVVNATILPLLLISNVLIPIHNETLTSIARLFPVHHLARALASAYDPAAPDFGFTWDSLAVVGGWGLAGLVVALVTFSWQPRG
ncbi:MAG: ABC transporter permease [Candidatus Limnocylindria bacterium]